MYLVFIMLTAKPISLKALITHLHFFIMLNNAMTVILNNFFIELKLQSLVKSFKVLHDETAFNSSVRIVLIITN